MIVAAAQDVLNAVTSTTLVSVNVAIPLKQSQHLSPRTALSAHVQYDLKTCLLLEPVPQGQVLSRQEHKLTGAEVCNQRAWTHQHSPSSHPHPRCSPCGHVQTTPSFFRLHKLTSSTLWYHNRLDVHTLCLIVAANSPSSQNS